MIIRIVEIIGRSTQGITRPFLCRGDDGQQSRMGLFDGPMRGGDQPFLPRMRAGGQPHGAPGQNPIDSGKFGLIDRQRRGGEFQVAGAFDVRRTQGFQPFGVQGATRLDVGERPQNAPGKTRRPPPTAETAVGHTSVDQHQLDASGLTSGQLVGPKLTFDEAGGVRLPVRQEPVDPGRHVQRCEPMQHVVGQAKFGEGFFQQRLGCRGARGQQHLRVVA